MNKSDDRITHDTQDREELRRLICCMLGVKLDILNNERPPESENEAFIRYLNEPQHWEAPKVWGDEGELHANVVKEKEVGCYTDFSCRRTVKPHVEIIQPWISDRASIPSFYAAGPRSKLYFDLGNRGRTIHVGIVTPGGLAPGLNTVIHGIVSRHQQYAQAGQARVQIHGFVNGLRGLVSRVKYAAAPLTLKDTQQHQNQAGCFLGVGREETEGAAADAIVDGCVRSLEAEGLDILYVIGGEGSMTAAHRIYRELEKLPARSSARRTIVAGIPKTIDNDLLWVWMSFGCQTAIQKATETIEDLHTDARDTQRIALVILMGRDSGFIAANATLASGNVDLVLVPEIHTPVNWSKAFRHVERRIKDNREHGSRHALVVVAEGLWQSLEIRKEIAKEFPPDGSSATSQDKRTVLKRFLTERFGEHFKDVFGGDLSVFVNDPGYQIRAVEAIASDRVLCRRLAEMAVDNALAGFTDFMISQYLTEYILVPLNAVVPPPHGEGARKKIPPNGSFWKEVIASTGQDDGYLLDP